MGMFLLFLLMRRKYLYLRLKPCWCLRSWRWSVAPEHASAVPLSIRSYAFRLAAAAPAHLYNTHRNKVRATAYNIQPAFE